MGEIPLDDSKMLMARCIRHLVYASNCMKSQRVISSCQEGQRVVKQTKQCGGRTGEHCPICRLCYYQAAKCKVEL